MVHGVKGSWQINKNKDPTISFIHCINDFIVDTKQSSFSAAAFLQADCMGSIKSLAAMWSASLDAITFSITFERKEWFDTSQKFFKISRQGSLF